MASKAKMLRRLALPAGALLAAVPVCRVHAASSDEQPKVLKPSQFPIYHDPEENNRYKFVEPEMTGFVSGISTVRQAVWQYLDTIKDTTDLIKDKYEIGKAHSLELYNYIQSEPDFLPRAGVILVAGLGGIVAGNRGGAVRKTFYSVAAMTAATSLCYPNQAVDVTSRTYNKVKSQISGSFGSTSGTNDTKSEDVKVVNEVKSSEDKEEKVVKGNNVILQPATSKGPVIVDESQKDPGQSNPDDKEMYSTRE